MFLQGAGAPKRYRLVKIRPLTIVISTISLAVALVINLGQPTLRKLFHQLSGHGIRGPSDAASDYISCHVRSAPGFALEKACGTHGENA